MSHAQRGLGRECAPIADGRAGRGSTHLHVLSRSDRITVTLKAYNRHKKTPP